MIKSIHIRNYKCFESRTIDLKPLTILAGSNSVGKSSVIQGLLLTRLSLDKILQFNLPNSSSNTTPQLKVPLNGKYNLSLGNTLEVLRRDAENDTIRFEFTNDQSAGVSFLSFRAEDRLKSSYNIELKEWSEISGLVALQNEFYYLAAERQGPRLSYSVDELDYKHAGWQGEYAIQVLSDVEAEIEDPSERGFEGSLDFKIINQVRSWMKFIIPGFYLDLVQLNGRLKIAEASFAKSSSTNVGFGISYVLPIVVNGLVARSGQVFIVENPEAHLHPKGQSNIGYFLGMVAKSGVQIVVETHSEHVVNGIRLASVSKGFTTSVQINFFSIATDGRVEVNPITIAGNGDLTGFPENFFDQAQQDLLKIFELGNRS